jgi:hypothetical protein
MDINQKTFRQGDDEKRPIDRAVKHPAVMLEPRPVNPNREPLDVDQLAIAMKDLHHKDIVNDKYIRNMKFGVDPKISGQHFGLISFIPSQNATPDSDGCFGILRLRGNFSTESEADMWAENLVKNHDSYAEIDTVFVGRPVPLFLNNERFTSKTREIDIRKVVTDIQKADAAEKAKKEQKEIQDIQERQRKLLNKETEEEKEKALTSLDYYVELRVKKANARALIDEAEKKIKEANEVIDKVSLEIAELDEKEPTYKDEFIEKYKQALIAVGANAEENPIIKYMSS